MFCESLEQCRSRSDSCDACKLLLAPGVITGGARPTRRHLRTALRWTWHVISVACVVVVVLGAVGLARHGTSHDTVTAPTACRKSLT